MPLAIDVYGLGIIAWERGHVGTDRDGAAAAVPHTQVTVVVDSACPAPFGSGGAEDSDVSGSVAFAGTTSADWVSTPLLIGVGGGAPGGWFRRGPAFEVEVAPRVPAMLAAVLRDCLQVQPEARPSAAAAQEALFAVATALQAEQ